MRQLVLDADRAGLHIAVHAIGDKANSDILDVFAAAIEANGPRDRWFPEQKITVEEAIEAYTLTSAYSSFDDDDRGSITPGKLADIVVLTKDILAISPGEIPNVEVAITIVGGRVVYEGQR